MSALFVALTLTNGVARLSFTAPASANYFVEVASDRWHWRVVAAVPARAGEHVTVPLACGQECAVYRVEVVK